MSIDIAERFTVRAPIDEVWAFLLDPEAVVQCMPGASLDGIEDEETFLGSIKVKIGPISTNYKGRVRFVERDDEARSMRLEADGRDKGGGTARGEMSSALTEESEGATSVEVNSSVVLTGRVMQFGRSIHEGVARQLFAEFQQRLTAQLEGGDAAREGKGGGGADAVPIVPLVASAAASAATSSFRRLIGRGSKDDDASTAVGGEETSE
jgi:hypothetical protein